MSSGELCWVGWSVREVLTPYNTGKTTVLFWFSCCSTSVKVKLQRALAVLQHPGVFTHCKNTPIFLHQAPLNPSEFSLLRTPPAVISCSPKTLIYPSVCPPASLGAALSLACANIINLLCPWACRRAARERGGEQGTQLQSVCVQGDACPATSAFFVLRPGRVSWEGYPRLSVWEIKASFPLSPLHAFEFYLHNLGWRDDFLMGSAWPRKITMSTAVVLQVRQG